MNKAHRITRGKKTESNWVLLVEKEKRKPGRIVAKIFLNSVRVGGRTATERGDTVSLFWVEGVEKEKERESREPVTLRTCCHLSVYVV